MISALLRYRSPQGTNQILNANRGLVDAWLVLTMAEAAEMLKQRGEKEASKFLMNLAHQITNELQLSSSTSTSTVIPTLKLQLAFFVQVYQVTEQSQSNPEAVYSLLKENLKLVNGFFVAVWKDWVMAMIPDLKSERAHGVAAVISNFSVLINDFPLGNRAINLEIAIAGYEVAAIVFTRSAYPFEWANAQNNLGTAYCERFRGRKIENLERAIRYFSNALKIRTRETESEKWAETQNNLGIACNHRIKGEKAENLEEAIKYFQAALEIRTQNNFPKAWAQTQYNLGSAYQERIRGNLAENLEKAIDCYLAALESYTQQDFPQYWADTQNNLGNIYVERIKGKKVENLEKAIKYYSAALEVYTHEAFPERWASLHNNLANVYLSYMWGDRKEHLEKAIRYCKAALQEYTQLGFPEQWALIQNNLGNAYLYRLEGDKLENLAIAISHYQAALDIRSREEFPQDYGTTQYNLGLAYKEARQFHKAYSAFAATNELIESFRSEIIFGSGIEGDKQKLTEKWNNFFSDMVEVCIEIGNLPEAIEYVERTKSRNLVELLAASELYPRGASEELKQQLRHLRGAISSRRQLLTQAENTHNLGGIEQKLARPEDRENLRGGNIQSSGLSEANREYIIQQRQLLQDYQRQLDRVFAECQKLDSAFTLTQKVEPISVAKIRTLIDPHTAILEWYIGTDGFQTFIVTKSNLDVVVFGKTELKRLSAWNQQYVQSLFNDTASWKTNLDQCLHTLSEILHLDEIISHPALANCHSLVLVPHRYLHIIPLHALPVGSRESEIGKGEASNPTPCLLDRFPGRVSYAPSCQLLELAQKRSRPEFSHLFAVQNPTEDLIYTDLEVEAIANHFHSREVLVKQQAKKSAIDDQRLGRAHCAHFSCHGYFNLQNPLLSALLLADCQVSPTPAQRKPLQYLHLKNGSVLDLSRCLTLADLFSKDLSACRLVTLSACETGLTDFTSLTDEYISLPSGFIYAGVPSVVSSLWRVYDSATALLMIKFYENLQRACHEAIQSEVPQARVLDGEGASSQTVSVARALNAAQIWLRDATKAKLQAWASHLKLSSELIQQIEQTLDWFNSDEQPFQDPMYWAAFCAIGQ